MLMPISHLGLAIAEVVASLGTAIVTATPNSRGWAASDGVGVSTPRALATPLRLGTATATCAFSAAFSATAIEATPACIRGANAVNTRLTALISPGSAVDTISVAAEFVSIATHPIRFVSTVWHAEICRASSSSWSSGGCLGAGGC